MNKLKELRIKNNLNQKDIAKFLKITQPNYSNIENGKIKLNIDYAKMLADFYSVPLSYIIEEKNTNQIFLTHEEFKILKEVQKIISKIENKYIK